MGTRKAAAAALAAFTFGLAAVTPALARPFANGVYTGKVRQAVPHAYAGAISFRVHGHKLTELQFTATMVCSRALVAQVQSPASTLKIRVARNGTFAYKGTVRGTKLKLQGTLHGHRARGTFFESFQTAPGHRCSMVSPAPFRTHA